MPKYKLGKQTHPIELETMQKIMDGKSFKKPSHRSYLAFLYLTGVRRSDGFERVKEDFQINDNYVTITMPPKKRGTEKTTKLSRDLPFMDLIVAQVEATKPKRKIWTFTQGTALNIVKRAMGKEYYPHFFRLNRCVHFLDDPTTTIPEMQSWFGWRDMKTINSYLGYSQRHIDRQAERLKERI